MRAFISGLLLASVTSLMGILWTFNSDVSALATWKEHHEATDNRQFLQISRSLKEIKDGQKRIINYLLNKK